jgi:hypothetical protein
MREIVTISKKAHEARKGYFSLKVEEEFIDLSTDHTIRAEFQEKLHLKSFGYYLQQVIDHFR